MTTPPSGLVIRPLRAEDVGQFFEPRERPRAEEWLAKQERGELYVGVAELDGVPVGLRCLDLSLCDEGIGFAFGASVVPELRSRGIGSMIDRHLEQVARARGLHTLRSSVAKHNEGAARWHERIGDRRTGEWVARWTEPDGREKEVECWTFERPLGRAAGGS